MENVISRWWRYGVLLIMLFGFAVLFWLSGNVYRISSPIPQSVEDPCGVTVFTGADITAGQQVFLKYALMENGTLWGHGAYLGPDFSAQSLHLMVLDVANELSRRDFGRNWDELTDSQQATLTGQIHELMVENRYDPASKTLTFIPAQAASFREQISWWKSFFSDPNANRGLPVKAMTNSEELRQLTAFFIWSAWSASTNIPGKTYSYTNNFPYEPMLDNGPSADAVLWSALSLIALLAGTAAVLFAFGRFDYLGWHSGQEHIHPSMLPGGANAQQKATLKFFVAASLLFLAQVLVGGALAHFRAQPGSFYGFNLSDILPSNVLRSWHLQMAILWIATAYVGGGLFMASVIGQHEPKRQVTAINVLFAALAVVIAGSLLGELAGVKQLLGKVWFWFGNQGWEYLEIGRAWQFMLAAGLVFWVILIVRAVGQSRKDPKHREISLLFIMAAGAIPVFYLPAFFFGSTTHFTIVDTWRFWIIHLWVEGFFELFVTVMVAVIFYKLSMVSLQTATRVIYLDAILFLGAGIIGTGHHWYWTGQSNISMALSATFSAMEVVPLILLTLDASDFVKLMNFRCGVCDKPIDVPHRWTFYFLISVGVWNFIGAGIFGFLINLPIVSYYEAGTNLTANHGHAALMGVFGMLAVALIVFALRSVSTDANWKHIQKYIAISFWGLNIGLALMLVTNLFPTGVLQFLDVIRNGYWHARSTMFSNQPLIKSLEWARMPADVIFIVTGVAPLTLAALLTYKQMLHPTK
jgi:nitric oxide reductase subunit B